MKPAPPNRGERIVRKNEICKGMEFTDRFIIRKVFPVNMNNTEVVCCIVFNSYCIMLADLLHCLKLKICCQHAQVHSDEASNSLKLNNDVVPQLTFILDVLLAKICLPIKVPPLHFEVSMSLRHFHTY